ncbi:MAG: CHAD domain-containing protein [bacterium]|nr:CHAD domain-containing protein [bacterium]
MTTPRHPDPPTPRTTLRFQVGETLAEGLGRVIGEQFAIALAFTTTPPEGQAVAVHETRKALKRLRALLRLVRDTISHDCYHTDNQVLKLVAAELGTVRDTWVMADVLDRLLPHNPNSQEAVETLIARLQDRFRTESLALLQNEAQMSSIIEQLEHVRERSRRWSIVAGEVDTPLPHNFASIAPGLQRVYKRGRRGMRIIVDSPTDTLLHVWRKRAKYLRHQIEALNVLDPVTLLRYELQLEQLTDLLGDDHDLAVLLTRFGDDPALVEGIELDLVLDAIGTKRHELQAHSIDLGREFFEDPSTDFLTYVESIWSTGDTF